MMARSLFKTLGTRYPRPPSPRRRLCRRPDWPAPPPPQTASASTPLLPLTAAAKHVWSKTCEREKIAEKSTSGNCSCLNIMKRIPVDVKSIRRNNVPFTMKVLVHLCYPQRLGCSRSSNNCRASASADTLEYIPLERPSWHRCTAVIQEPPECHQMSIAVPML